jgi:predicted nucleic acid-binding protein
VIVSGTASTGSSVVLDASAAIRALVIEQPEAAEWVERVVDGELVPAWPAHFYAEVAQTLMRMVRARQLERRRAADIYLGVGLMHAQISRAERLHEAMELAFERSLSVYDAAYVVLAEALDASLVTADRRLAEATEQGVLLPG